MQPLTLKSYLTSACEEVSLGVRVTNLFDCIFLLGYFFWMHVCPLRVLFVAIVTCYIYLIKLQ